jgi:hypothetical protein
MVTTATPAPEAPAPEPVSSVGRIFGVLFTPKATFESIAKQPTWILPVILACVVGILVTFVIGKQIGWRAVVEKRISQSASAQKQMEQLSPEDREKNLNAQAKFSPYIVYAINIVGPFIGALLLALIFWGAFNLIYGTKMGFKTSLGIVSYGWIPELIIYILAIPILFLKDPATVDIQNIVASNPAAILSDDSARWLVALLGSLDIFSFWTMILLAFGFSAAEPKKVSFGKAFGMVLLLWIIFVLGKVGLTAAFS